MDSKDKVLALNKFSGYLVIVKILKPKKGGEREKERETERERCMHSVVHI